MEEIRKHQELEEKGEIKYALDEVRFAQVKKSYEALHKLFDSEENVEIKLEIGSLSKSYMTITMRSLYFDMEAPLFVEAISNANGISIDSLNKGEKVQMKLSFDNVAQAYKLKPLKKRMKVIKPDTAPRPDTN